MRARLRERKMRIENGNGVNPQGGIDQFFTD